MGATIHSISGDIVEWVSDHPRPMPWKRTKDPYKIWLSEIILQQTQVAQGIPYYKKFITKYPTLKALSSASEDEVLRAWQGLGYNSRARNMHFAARKIVSDNGGVFPRTYEGILAMKGVGEYTAAAVASFAFGHRTPVLDSNVIRVVSRLFGIAGLATDKATRQRMYEPLHRMISKQDPALFNQAIMNFGAECCTARNPGCNFCPVSDRCIALRDDLVNVLPIKPARPARRTRFLHYFMICDAKGMIIRKRALVDIWPGMYELPCLETGSWRKPPDTADLLRNCGLNPAIPVLNELRLSQKLTHQEICCRFYRIQVSRLARKRQPKGSRFELFENLEKFAFPKVIRTYLNQQSISI
jgi:A/G-specific adenine glycosylase